MKFWIPAVFFAGLVHLSAEPLAGAALGVFSAIAGQPYAAKAEVVEIRGERGQPQPASWVVLLKDPTARGGVREVTVARGQIVAERTPLRGMSEVSDLPPLDRAVLSVDSDRVFQIAQREAEKNEVGFHWIDYVLRSDAENRTPVWDVKLFDHMGAPVGSFRVSAQGGTLVQGFVPDAGRAGAEAPPPRSRGIVGEIGDTAESIAKKTQKSTLRFIGSVQEAIVGERTIGPKEDE